VLPDPAGDQATLLNLPWLFGHPGFAHQPFPSLPFALAYFFNTLTQVKIEKNDFPRVPRLHPLLIPDQLADPFSISGIGPIER
jgi:hypothetical protein